MTQTHEVLLNVPAMPEFLRVVRVTASGLSGRLGFSIDDVDDLRLALDELCFLLIGKGRDEEVLRLTYEVGNDALNIRGSSSFTAPADEPLAEFSRQILTALVDDHRVWNDDDGRHFSLSKRRSALTSSRSTGPDSDEV